MGRQTPCLGLTDLFYSDREDDIAAAIDVCCSCALRRPCLERALARREPAGVWGGKQFGDQRQVPKELRIPKKGPEAWTLPLPAIRRRG